ncbi:MAG: hypothetical protein ACFFD1_00825 [Candidatus Thorarchaeota archaeon]
MNILHWIFAEPDGSFSWRKGLTAIAGIAFLFAVIGNLFGLPELPKPYWLTIDGVFIFYFIKTAIRKIGEKKDDKSQT